MSRPLLRLRIYTLAILSLFTDDEHRELARLQIVADTGRLRRAR